MFEKATRKKLRFSSKFGELTVEQLWDLKLQDLNTIAVELDNLIKNEPSKKSFLKNDNSIQKSDNQDKLDIVIHIIMVKEQELEDKRLLISKKQELELIKEAAAKELNSRKVGKISELSDEELRKILS